MVLRETTFVVGGGLTIGLGVALAVGLWVARAGLEFLPAWLAAGLAVGFGGFFVQVGRSAAKERRRHLRELESGEEPRTGSGAP